MRVWKRTYVPVPTVHSINITQSIVSSVSRHCCLSRSCLCPVLKVLQKELRTGTSRGWTGRLCRQIPWWLTWDIVLPRHISSPCNTLSHSLSPLSSLSLRCSPCVRVPIHQVLLREWCSLHTCSPPTTPKIQVLLRKWCSRYTCAAAGTPKNPPKTAPRKDPPLGELRDPALGSAAGDILAALRTRHPVRAD